MKIILLATSITILFSHKQNFIIFLKNLVTPPDAVDPGQLSSRTSFEGFGHSQKLSQLRPPPKYYCFHPGTLHKNVYLRKVPGCIQ